MAPASARPGERLHLAEERGEVRNVGLPRIGNPSGLVHRPGNRTHPLVVAFETGESVRDERDDESVLGVAECRRGRMA